SLTAAGGGRELPPHTYARDPADRRGSPSRRTEAPHPGGHIQLRFAEPDALRAAAAMIPDAVPDDDQLILQIPGDGSVASLRRLLNELDDTSIDVEHLSIHSPDLDDVFFAVTGHATTDQATPQDEKVLQP